MQQTGPRSARPLGYESAEREAARVSAGFADVLPVAGLGARPFGSPAAATPDPPSAADGQQVVAAADVERLRQEITRVVVAANLPGVDMVEVAEVLRALQDYGNAGKVVWGHPHDGADGQYDHTTDTIMLSKRRFDIHNPGHVAAVAIFHEASHTLRWRTAGPAADAAQTAEAGPGATIEDTYRAAINRELKLYREEVLAYTVGDDVMYSYWAEIGLASRERAIELVAAADPTKGSSAEKSLTRLGDLAMEFRIRAQRDVALDRFLRDAKVWAASGENMPEFRNYIML